jgi:quercetin dioxygenase-like cupin family protein
MDSTTAEQVFLHSIDSSGVLFNLRTNQHPTVVNGWANSQLELESGSTHFGFVGSGSVRLTARNGTFELKAGMYFALPDEGVVKGVGRGFVASLIGHNGLFQIGGPVERTGRLRYIDGCSDTLLVAPPKLGDPCLNLLHIPPQTNQTAHTHPSIRVGMVLDGEGFCRTKDNEVRLEPGLVFVIQTDGVHSFHTTEQSLRIVAWHPDSDFGPTDETHPMVNRTQVNGLPIHSHRGSQ